MTEPKQNFSEEFDFSKIPIEAFKYDSISVGNPMRLKEVAKSVTNIAKFFNIVAASEDQDFSKSFTLLANGMSDFAGGVDYCFSTRMIYPRSQISYSDLRMAFSGFPEFARFDLSPGCDDLIFFEMVYCDVAKTPDEDYETEQGVIRDAQSPLIDQYARHLWFDKFDLMSDDFDFESLNDEVIGWIHMVGFSLMHGLVQRNVADFRSEIDDNADLTFGISQSRDELILSVSTRAAGITLDFFDIDAIRAHSPENGFLDIYKSSEDDIVINFHYEL